MTTEDDFQAALDANPGDWQTRLVFADWLQECARDLPCPACKGKGEIRGDGVFSAGKPCLVCGGRVLGPHSYRKGSGFVSDTRAEGYRALGVLVLYPWFDATAYPWDYRGYGDNLSCPGCWSFWYSPSPEPGPGDEADRSYLPMDWFAELPPTFRYDDGAGVHSEDFWTRREAEDAAALAFAKLPAARRAELLAR
jgi:uncharacterized protein (TIGR02996 family)